MLGLLWYLSKEPLKGDLYEVLRPYITCPATGTIYFLNLPPIPPRALNKGLGFNVRVQGLSVI